MCYIVGDEHLISGRSPQVVNTNKTRSAVVISFQVVSRRMAVLRSIHEGFGILYFDTKACIFGVHPRVTAAMAAAATEEFSSTASPHPIMHRGHTISRSDHPSLRCIGPSRARPG